MPSSQELTEQQKAQWNAAAPGWERSSDWFDRNNTDLIDWMCDAAGIGPGSIVLDVACGAGQPSTTAAQRVRPNGRVTAIDLSPQMADVTRRKAQRLGLDNLDARDMDAQALTFPDASFDAATCRFGLMFCPDPVRAAAEIYRVLRPAARVAVAVWGLPASNPFFTSLASVIGRFVPMPPPDPSAPGIFRLAPPGELERVLRAAGFADVSAAPRPMTLVYDSLDEYWRIQTDLAAPLRAALASLTPERVVEMKAQLVAEIAPYMDGRAVRLAAVPLCASARRPAR
jgi:ubiquinone/menaquinone biosynthesis C-methylase UbiE